MFPRFNTYKSSTSFDRKLCPWIVVFGHPQPCVAPSHGLSASCDLIWRPEKPLHRVMHGKTPDSMILIDISNYLHFKAELSHSSTTLTEAQRPPQVVAGAGTGRGACWHAY